MLEIRPFMIYFSCREFGRSLPNLRKLTPFSSFAGRGHVVHVDFSKAYKHGGGINLLEKRGT